MGDAAIAQAVLNWTAVVLYVLSTVCFAYGISFRKEGALRPALLLVATGLLPHTAALLVRWKLTGHGPYMAKYEVLSSTAWISLLLFLIVALRTPRLRSIGVIVVPLSFLMMAVGLFLSPEIRRLPPSLRSIWLVIHVFFNKLAAGAILIALGTSVLYLLREKDRDGERYRKLPPPDILDAYSYRFVGFGFIFWSITVAAGAIWANEVWGRYWGWDPIETWSLITWLLFGLYLHMRHFLGWKGKKAAWLMVVCFAFSVLTIFIIPFIVPSLHAEYFR